MKVFVTGATGFIGSALVPDLVAGGHEVVGLARSDRSAAALARMGAGAHRGDLEDPASLAAGAAAAEGVIHLAFDHGGMADDMDAVIRSDRRAIDALADALAATGKPLVGTSGVMVLAPGSFGDEETAADPRSPASFRVPSENAVLAAAGRGVRACVVRLSPVVHGEGDAHGFVPTLIGAARDAGGFAYVADADARWPAVHRLDAARLFRLALERGEAGRRYHGVAEEKLAVRDIATALGDRLGLPVDAVAPDQASARFGPLAPFAAADIRTAAERTRAALGWTPTGPTLVADIRAGVYDRVGGSTDARRPS